MEKNLKTNKYAFKLSELKELKTELINPLTALKKSNQVFKKNFYDDLINSDTLLKKYNNNINKIKEESIKEFVFTNRTIPIKWTKIKNYQEIVIKSLIKNPNFLSYVGNERKDNEKINIRPKTNGLFNRKSNIYKKFRSFSSSFYKINQNNSDLKLTKNIIKERCMTPSNSLKHLKNEISSKKDLDLNNLFSDYQIKFPIKEKLKKLFPKRILSSINEKNIDLNESYNEYRSSNEIDIKNHINKIIKNNKKSNHLIKRNELSPKKKKKILTNNIYSKLLSFSDSKIKKNPNKIINENSIKDKNNSIFLNDNSEDFYKKKNFNNKFIKTLLESINNFGPYYSYCPPCKNKNIDFYNRLGKDKSIQLIKFIKKLKENKKKQIKNRNIINNKNI